VGLEDMACFTLYLAPTELTEVLNQRLPRL
jgi:hypothetical protein